MVLTHFLSSLDPHDYSRSILYVILRLWRLKHDIYRLALFPTDPSQFIRPHYTGR